MSEPSERTVRFEVDPSEAGRRLDVVVASRLEDVSRAQVKRWIEDGRVRSGGKIARAGKPARAGDRIAVAIPAPVPAEPEAEPIPLSVIYEDEHLIVVDKPAGMVVHPAPGHPSGTLVNALLAHCRDLSGVGGVERPGIVHRLDVGTTGVLVAAKHDRAHRALSEAFAERRVDKRYNAVVHGHPPEPFVIDAAIGRDPMHRTRISSRGERKREALTEVTRVERLSASALLEVRLHTGRTHQIRVHLSEAGFPLVGDRDYGPPRRRPPAPGATLARPALHARSLSLAHPISGRPARWEAPLPADIEELLRRLRPGASAGREPQPDRSDAQADQ